MSREDDPQFVEAVNQMVTAMRRRNIPVFTIELGDRPPEAGPPPGAGIDDLLFRLMGDDPLRTADRLKTDMSMMHASGRSWLLPDGDNLNRIKVGKKFPDNFYIQHDQETLWLVRRILSLAGEAASSVMRRRLECTDSFDREYISPEVASNDARRGYVCIELRSNPALL